MAVPGRGCTAFSEAGEGVFRATLGSDVLSCSLLSRCCWTVHGPLRAPLQASGAHLPSPFNSCWPPGISVLCVAQGTRCTRPRLPCP